jgi:hypothetical protein
LRNHPLIRHGVSRLAPLMGGLIRRSWRDRQIQLRQGYGAFI